MAPHSGSAVIEQTAPGEAASWMALLLCGASDYEIREASNWGNAHRPLKLASRLFLAAARVEMDMQTSALKLSITAEQSSSQHSLISPDFLWLQLCVAAGGETFARSPVDAIKLLPRRRNPTVSLRANASASRSLQSVWSSASSYANGRSLG